MRTLLSHLPEEVLLCLCSEGVSQLYPTCVEVTTKVRRATTKIELRYLHKPEQLKVYGGLKSVKTHSIDIRSHSLHDYLPVTVTELSLLNVALTDRLLSLVPSHVTSLHLNRRDPLFASEELCERYSRDGSIDWAQDHHQEYNLPELDWSLLHGGLRKLRVASRTVWKLTGPSLTTVDFNRDQSGQELPPNLEEWYDADIIHPSNDDMSRVRVVHADLVILKQACTMRDLLPNIESFSGRSLDGVDAYFLSALPVNLTTLKLNEYQHTDELMALLKQSKVTSLMLSTVDLSQLWKGLKELQVTSDRTIHYMSLEKLPRSLKTFSIYQVSLLPSEGTWPELESLAVKNLYDGEHVCLPKTIHTLFACVGLWDKCKGDGLRPRSLCIIGDSYSAHSQYIHSLPDSITSLELHYLNVFRVPESVRHLRLRNSANHLPSLPSNLLTLQVENTFGKNGLHSSFIEALPLGLRELSLEEAVLDNSALALLPPRLVRLDVPCRGLGMLSYLDLPESLAVIASSDVGEDFVAGTATHPALCHAYSWDVEQ